MNKKPLPILYKKKEYCCGCTACYAVCPQNAIYMEADQEGFLYPIIREKICLRCYQCISVCAFKEAQKIKGFYKVKDK